MKIEHLREFYYLGKLLNYTSTAQMLYTTQPVLSRHIALMEEELSFPLLKRSTRKVELTPEGKILHDSLPEVLCRYDAAISTINNMLSPEKSEIRLALPAIPSNDYLNDVPSILKKTCPLLELVYYFGDPEDNIQKIQNGEMDLCLVANIPFPGYEMFHFTDLEEEPMILFVNESDPLAGRRSIPLSELKSCRFIRMENKYYSTIWEQFRLQCKYEGFEPKSSITAAQMQSALAYVRQGKGVLTAGAHHRSLAVKGLSYVRIESDHYVRKLSLAHLSSNANPMIQKVIEAFLSIREQFEYNEE